MDRLPMRASTDYRKVLVVAILGLFFCTVAATVTLAQEAPASREGVAFDLPKQEQPVVYRKHNPAAAFSLRNNLAWDATGSFNLGFELPLGRHAAIGGNFGFKSWDRFFFWEGFSYVADTDPSRQTKWRHLSIVPEFRYYLRDASRGHFFGADLLWIHYNVGGVKLPLGLYPAMADQRLQGDLLGAGLFYGYAFPLGAHWRIETEIGVAGGRYSDRAYECVSCGLDLGPRSGWTLVPKVGVNVVYVFVKKTEK
jgi:hypothetical protein